MDPLYIFIDLEASHGDLFFGDIVEIAAQVDPDVLEYEVFESLVNTDQPLAFFTLEKCKITKDLLDGQPYFPDAFKSFIDWIRKVRKKSEKLHRKSYFPVLVAHGGFDNDFMMIQGNLERNNMDVNMLSENNLHFGDTYLLARQLKEKGEEELSGCQLSIEALLKRFFPKEKFKGLHRAMNDVRYMIKIFYETKLKKSFHKLPIATFENRNTDYSKRNKKKGDTKELNENIPGGLAKVTHTMTLKRLLRNGYSLKKLEELFECCESHLHFYDKLKDLGIERKAAKAMASRLNSMGFLCGRNAKLEQSDMAVDISNTLSVADNVSLESSSSMLEEKKSISDNEENKKEDLKPSINRLDSGYGSLSEDFPIDSFHDMFIDEFFQPPLTYEYTFGSFTKLEIQNIDDEIDNLFHELFLKGKLEEPEENYDNYVEKLSSSSDEEENWEKDVCETPTEFCVPFDHGRLAKVIPVGVSEENITGKAPIGRVPLFTCFEPTVENKPDGGIPQPKSKLNRKFKRQRQQMFSKEGLSSFKLSDCTDNRTFVKSSNGRVYLLP